MVRYKCNACGQSFDTEKKLDGNVCCPLCGSNNMACTEIPNGGTANGYDPNMYNGAYNSGYQQGYNYAYNQISRPGVFDAGPSGKCRGVAGLLAIFLGAFGVHYFYLGKTFAGLLFLALTVLSCGVLSPFTGLFSLVQGIVFFTLTQEQFEQKFIYSYESVPLF